MLPGYARSSCTSNEGVSDRQLLPSFPDDRVTERGDPSREGRRCATAEAVSPRPDESRARARCRPIACLGGAGERTRTSTPEGTGT